MPCHAHAALCRGLDRLLRHGRGMAQARHGMCESNMAALCKSTGKDTISTLSGTAWQGNGMGAACERDGMCELASSISSFLKPSLYEQNFGEGTNLVYSQLNGNHACVTETTQIMPGKTKRA
jgi:hypothetical protein